MKSNDVSPTNKQKMISDGKVDIRNKTTKEKLSYFSVIIFCIGSCIGAGIFFKNSEILDNTGGNVYLMYLAWTIAIIGVVMIGFTLKELSSKAVKYGSLGYVGWVRYFCGEKLYRGCRNFLIYIYLTTNFFLLPYYSVQALQDAVGVLLYGGQDPTPWRIPTYGMILISFLIMFYLTFSSSISIKTANFQSLCLTFLKFIPLMFAAVGGIVLFALHKTAGNTSLAALSDSGPKKFTGLSPALGVFASIPAIFFAFDGFYTASASFDKMKNPKKGSLAIALGIAVVSFVYIFVSLGIWLATRNATNNAGTIIAFAGLFDGALWWRLIIFVVLLCIVFAVFGIINGFGLYGSEIIGEEVKNGQLPFSSFFKRKFDWSKRLGVTVYSVSMYIIFFVILTFISFAWTAGSDAQYGSINGKILNLCDLIANWSALFAFVFIALAILFCLIQKLRATNISQKFIVKKQQFIFKKKRTKKWVFLSVITLGLFPLIYYWMKKKTKMWIFLSIITLGLFPLIYRCIKSDNKFYCFAATIAVLLVGVALVYQMVDSFYDLLSSIVYYSSHSSDSIMDYLIPNVIKAVLFLVCVFFSFIQPYILNKKVVATH